MTKNELRKLLKTELSAVSAEKKLSASKKACGLLFEFVLKNNFDIVLSYIDLKNEISPQEINCALMMKNKIVAVPKVVPKTQRMNFYILDNSIKILKQLETGAFGISEPIEKKQNLFNADNFVQKKICVVVPGVAVMCFRPLWPASLPEGFMRRLPKGRAKSSTTTRRFSSGMFFSFIQYLTALPERFM